MDKQDFYDFIEARLGGNLVEVELTTEDYRTAFEVAKSTFIQRGNNNLEKKFYALSVTAGTRSYTLPTAENIDTVIRIIKPRSGLGTDDPFSLSVIQEMFSVQSTLTTDTSLLTYELSKQLLDNINIYFVNDTPFIYKPRNSSLELLDPPKVDQTWFLECFCNLTDAEYRDVLWVQNYALAEAKIILGRAYSKFSSLTTPAGEVSLNGEALISEGKDEKTTLLENIDQYVDGGPTGGVIFIG